MEISAKVVMDLRAKTGVSMMACKKALVEAGGDEVKAIEILRKSGEAKALSKAERDTTEGVVFADIRGNKGVLVELRCETDFVARNEDFVATAKAIAEAAHTGGVAAAEATADEAIKAAVVKLGENIQLGGVKMIEGDSLGFYIHANNKTGAIVAMTSGNEQLGRDLSMQAVAAHPEVVNPEDVDSALVESEMAIEKEKLLKEGKPEQILEKILEGKVRKFREERAMLTQDFIKDPSKKVRDVLGGATVTGFVKFAI